MGQKAITGRSTSPARSGYNPVSGKRVQETELTQRSHPSIAANKNAATDLRSLGYLDATLGVQPAVT